MPIPAVEFLRSRDPRLRDVPEDELVRFAGDTYPELLPRDRALADRFSALTGQETALDPEVEERRAGRLFEMAGERRKGERLEAVTESAPLEGFISGLEKMSPIDRNQRLNIPQREVRTPGDAFAQSLDIITTPLNPLKAVGSEVVAPVAKWAGNVGEGAMRDVRRGGPPSLRGEFGRGLTGPLDTTPETSPVARGLDAAGHTLGQLLPAMAAPSATLGAMSTPAAFATAAGSQALADSGGQVAPALMAAGTAFAIPGVGAAGRAAAAKGLGAAIERGLLSADRTLLQKGVETLASQGAMMAFMEGMNLPAYIEATPEQRRDMLVQNMVQNTAFLALDLPVFNPRLRSEVQSRLGPEVRVAHAVQELVNRPEAVDMLREAADQFARDALRPERAVRTVPGNAPPERRTPLFDFTQPPGSDAEVADRILAVRRAVEMPEPPPYPEPLEGQPYEQTAAEKFKAFHEKNLQDRETRRVTAMAAAGDASVVRLESKDGRSKIISQSATEPGKWRITNYDKNGEPWGHDLMDSRDDAIMSAIGLRGKWGPPHGDGSFKVVSARKRAGGEMDYPGGEMDAGPAAPPVPEPRPAPARSEPAPPPAASTPAAVEGKALGREVPQVAQPLKMQDDAVLIYDRNGLATGVQGKRYILPGFEELQFVMTRPTGAKAKGTKRGWTLWEKSSGLQIAESTDIKGKPTSEREVVDMAMQRLRAIGKAGLQERVAAQRQAIEAARLKKPTFGAAKPTVEAAKPTFEAEKPTFEGESRPETPPPAPPPPQPQLNVAPPPVKPLAEPGPMPQSVTEVVRMESELEARIEALKSQRDDLKRAFNNTIPATPESEAAGQRAMLVNQEIIDLSTQRDNLKMERHRAEWRANGVYGLPEQAARDPKITPKVLKAQKEYLLEAVEKAIKEAPEEGAEMITIAVPGDGEWTILNTKERLRNFKTLINEGASYGRKGDKYSVPAFPTTLLGTGMPSLKKAKAKKAPKAKSGLDGEDLVDIAGKFVSEDQTRFVITETYADGTQIVATDGRQLIRIVSDKAPGTLTKPQRHNAEGDLNTEPSGRFPDWTQVRPPRTEVIAAGVDVQKLHHIAQQAKVFRDLTLEADKQQGAGVGLVRNPDGSIGGRMDIVGEVFEHNIQPNAVRLGNYNPDYLLNIAATAAKLGDKVVDFRAPDDSGPLVAAGSKFEVLLMPMKLGSDFLRDNMQALTKGAGNAVHRELPKGYGPLDEPGMLRSRGVKVGTTDYSVSTVGDTLKIESHVTVKGRQGNDVQTKSVGEWPLIELPEGDKALSAKLKDYLKGHTQNVGEFKDAVKELLAERRQAERALAEREKQSISTGALGDKGSATEATINQATLPRRIDDATVPPGDAPVSLSDIREYLSKALDIPVRVRGFRQQAQGIFKVKPEVIRQKLLNDVPTLAHEVGHYLHYLLFPAGSGRASNFGHRYDTELMTLGAVTSKPSYTPAQVRREGVAEFTRLWLTDPAKAAAQAPSFAAFWQAEIQRNHNPVWKILRQAQKDIARYVAQPDSAKLDSIISVDRDKPSEPLGRRFQRWTDNWINDLGPIERSMEYLQGLGLNAGQAEAVTDYAVNYIGGWRGKAQADLFHRQTDLNGNDVGPGLREILSGLDDVQAFRRYAVAKRALEKSAQGKMVAPDQVEMVRAARNEVANGRAQHEARRLALLKFQRNARDLLVQSGVLSPEQARRMDALNEDYVPFHRVTEKVSGGKGSGEGFINLGQGIHAFKGSDRLIIDPLESVIKNVYLFRDLAERNRVGSLFTSALDTTQGGGRIGDGIARALKPVQVSHAETVKALKDAGIDTDGLGVEGVDLAFKVWRAGQQQKPADGIFTVWRGGQEKRYQIDDPELYRALTLADATQGRIFNQFPLAPVLRGFTRIKRAGATLTPEFIARNPFRDQVTAGVFTRNGYIPFWDGFRGALSVLGKDKWYWDWVKAGGRYSDFVAMDRTDLQSALADVIKEPTALNTALGLANPLNVIRNLQKFSELMEAATRVSEFRRAKQAGKPDVEAANDAKEVTLNFARGGFKGKALNQLSAFFNANVQDWSKVLREHNYKADPKRALQVQAKALLYITAPSVLAWILGRDDERIQSLPGWRKQFFWNINLKPLADIAGVEMDDFVLSFPKPFLLGQLYGTSVERGLDYATNRDPNAVRKWTQGIVEATPFYPANIVPSAVQPIAETWANRNAYTGNPIENQAQQNLPREFRINPGTSQTAQELSRMLPFEWASPVKVDNLIRGYFAGLGKYGTTAADYAMSKAQLVDIPEPPEKTIWERPVLRAFTRSPYEASDAVRQFYDGIERAERRVQALRQGPAFIQDDRMAKWARAEAAPLLFYTMPVAGEPMISRLRQARQDMGDIVKAMAQVQRDRTMSGREKAEKLRTLSVARDELGKAAVQLYLAPVDKGAVR